MQSGAIFKTFLFRIVAIILSLATIILVAGVLRDKSASSEYKIYPTKNRSVVDYITTKNRFRKLVYSGEKDGYYLLTEVSGIGKPVEPVCINKENVNISLPARIVKNKNIGVKLYVKGNCVNKPSRLIGKTNYTELDNVDKIVLDNFSVAIAMVFIAIIFFISWGLVYIVYRKIV